MADEYELNQTQTEQTVPSEQPVRRRRRRQRRPKWQRLLWKYWPPIRFGLIILAGILLIWLLISGIAGLFRGDQPDDPNGTGTSQEDPAQTTPPATTDSPETTEPTPPPTTEPIVIDPYADAVDSSWFDNTLFIGDFTVGGMKDHARSGNAAYFATSGMGVFNYDSQTASDLSFTDQTLDALLTDNSYDKIIVNLGINNCGYPTSSLINAYSELIDYLRVQQPGAKIILQGILSVTQNYASGREYFAADNIAQVNAQIAELADGVHVYYINVNENFTDSSGYLNANFSTDGCHLYSSSYADMAKWISVAVGRLGIE